MDSTRTGNESRVARTPLWVVVVRGFQFILAVIILGLSAYIIRGVYFDELGFAIVCSLFTWLIVAYNLLTPNIQSLHAIHNNWAEIGLDALMVVFWLSAMGATGALRSRFRYSVTIEGCYNDGSAVNSNHCIVSRAAAVANKDGLSMISSVAGLSALNMLLFIATLVYSLVIWFRKRRSAAHAETSTNNTSGAYAMTPPQQSAMQQQQAMPEKQVGYNQQSYGPQPV